MEIAAVPRNLDAPIDVQNLTQAISCEQKKVLSLSVEGHTTNEIARVTRTSRGTVASRIRLAMKKMRKKIKDL